jgi:hypothetical protein
LVLFKVRPAWFFLRTTKVLTRMRGGGQQYYACAQLWKQFLFEPAKEGPPPLLFLGMLSSAQAGFNF